MENMKRLKEVVNNIDELRRVIEVNSKFQDDIVEDMKESEIFWINEQLGEVKSSLFSYNIGFNEYNYIIVKKDMYKDFVEGCKNLQKEYELFENGNSDYCKLFDYTLELINKVYLTDINDALFEEYNNEIENNIEKIKNRLLKYFNSVIEQDFYDIDFIMSYIDTYIYNIDIDNYYVNNNYELFKYTMKSLK